MRDFGGLVRLAEAKHVLSVFDACFAGTIFEAKGAPPSPAITRATTMPVRQVLTSGDADQQVTDDTSFRTFFLRALRGEERADANGDGYLTAGELSLFMTGRVTNYTHSAQTPRFGKLLDVRYDRGDFVFVLPETEVASAPKPAAPVDMQVWDRIEDSTDAADFVTFLESFPSSPMVPFARNKLKALTEEETALVALPEPEAPAVADDAVGVYPQTFRDCAECPEMVVIPPGEFVMGSFQDAKEFLDGGHGPENPRHSVTIPQDFALGRYEVTVAEWDSTGAYSPCQCMAPPVSIRRISSTATLIRSQTARPSTSP